MDRIDFNFLDQYFTNVPNSINSTRCGDGLVTDVESSSEKKIMEVYYGSLRINSDATNNMGVNNSFLLKRMYVRESIKHKFDKDDPATDESQTNESLKNERTKRQIFDNATSDSNILNTWGANMKSYLLAKECEDNEENRKQRLQREKEKKDLKTPRVISTYALHALNLCHSSKRGYEDFINIIYPTSVSLESIASEVTNSENSIFGLFLRDFVKVPKGVAILTELFLPPVYRYKESLCLNPMFVLPKYFEQHYPMDECDHVILEYEGENYTLLSLIQNIIEFKMIDSDQTLQSFVNNLKRPRDTNVKVISNNPDVEEIKNKISFDVKQLIYYTNICVLFLAINWYRETELKLIRVDGITDSIKINRDKKGVMLKKNVVYYANRHNLFFYVSNDDREQVVRTNDIIRLFYQNI